MASVSNKGFLWCLASTLLGLSLFIKIAFTWNLLYLTPQLSLNYRTWRIHSNIIFVFNIQYVYVCIYIYISSKKIVTIVSSIQSASHTTIKEKETTRLKFAQVTHYYFFEHLCFIFKRQNFGVSTYWCEWKLYTLFRDSLAKVGAQLHMKTGCM